MAEKKEKQYVSDNAQLMAEWDWEKNNAIGNDPTTLTLGMAKKAWWKCSKGHVWESIVVNRVKGSGCPYCSGRKVLTGFNDFLTINSSLASEWNFQRNNILKPNDVTANSGRKVWWKCSKGHEWQATIASRNSGRGCPYCAGKIVLAGQNDLLTQFPLLAREWNYEKNKELTPSDVMPNSNAKVWWRCNEGHEWQAAISHRSRGSGCPYCAGQKVLVGQNDLQTMNPSLASEWNYEKNNGLTPSSVMPNSSIKVWWKCSLGHEWQAVIANRSKGIGCPYCAGQKVLVGQNDLQTMNPSLASEWNYEKNNGLTPSSVMPNSSIKVWWKCSLGHEWQATVSNRNKERGCPYCSGKKVLLGYNDLATINPILIKEWNYEKNGALKPQWFTANSNKSVWWKCRRGHEWEATIYHRNSGQKCPVCSSEQQASFPEYALLYYLNKYGLDTIHSYKEKGYELDIYIPSMKIAIEYDGYYWHKNKAKQDLSKNNKCKEDGIKLFRIREELPSLYDSSIDYVIQKYPKDFQKIIVTVLSDIAGITADVDVERDAIAIESMREHSETELSLLYSNLAIAQEWNFEKNGDLRPEHFSASSGKKVWWKCSHGHEWQAVISSRNNGNGCPYCAGQKLLKGKNDLATVNPSLAGEWNYERNKGLTPIDVMAGSRKVVWWKCSEGHEWQSTICNRHQGTRCPYCSRRIALKGVTDLQTVNSTLASEWNYGKNGRLTPQNVLPNSGKKVWWKCGQGHEWQATIASRNSGCGCPECAKQKRKKKNT